MNTEREREREEQNALELAMEISLTSLGSSQTFPLPHLSTLAESRFWSFNDTIAAFLAGPPFFPTGGLSSSMIKAATFFYSPGVLGF